MNELSIIPPVGWDEISADSNERILCMYSDERMIITKIRLVNYQGNQATLRKSFFNRVDSVTTVMDKKHESFIFDNIKWYADSYVCKTQNEKYRSYYYALLDDCYIVFEMLTSDSHSVIQFLTEVRRLILSIDYTMINRSNHILIGDKHFLLETPSSFRFSNDSNEEHLIFVSENGYLLVNVPVPADMDLQDCIREQLDIASYGLNCCKVEIQESCCKGNVEWVTYRMTNLKNQISTGTYFKQVLSESTVILSFLFESGVNRFDISTLLQFREEVEFDE